MKILEKSNLKSSKSDPRVTWANLIHVFVYGKLRSCHVLSMRIGRKSDKELSQIKKIIQVSLFTSLRGRRVKNQYGAKKKRGARGRETRDGESTHTCLSLARVSRAPHIFHAPATQAIFLQTLEANGYTLIFAARGPTSETI